MSYTPNIKSTEVLPSKSAQQFTYNFGANAFVHKKKNEKIDAPKPIKAFAGLNEEREQTPVAPEFSHPTVAVSADLPHLGDTTKMAAVDSAFKSNVDKAVKAAVKFVPKKKQKKDIIDQPPQSEEEVGLDINSQQNPASKHVSFCQDHVLGENDKVSDVAEKLAQSPEQQEEKTQPEKRVIQQDKWWEKKSEKKEEPITTAEDEWQDVVSTKTSKKKQKPKKKKETQDKKSEKKSETSNETKDDKIDEEKQTENVKSAITENQDDDKRNEIKEEAEIYKPPTPSNIEDRQKEKLNEQPKEENFFKPATRIRAGEAAPKEDGESPGIFKAATRIRFGEPAPQEEQKTEAKRIEEDIDDDKMGIIIPPSVKSVPPHVPQNVYSIDQMLDLRSKKVRARDSMFEMFQKFTMKEKKEEKLFTVDQSKAMYRQWFNQLTEITIDKVTSEMALQMRSKDDVETMLSILFKNAINERRYVQLYVKFFVKVRNAMLVVDTKKDLAIDMIKFLLGKAENQFTHPPTVRMPSENETDIERIEREDANAVDEFEYLGTVFLVSYLYTEGTVIADLVLQCLHSLSNIKGRLPTKAFTTLIKETCDKLVNEKVDMTDVLNTIKKMQAVDGISKFEQIVLENSKDQIIKAVEKFAKRGGIPKQKKIKKVEVKTEEFIPDSVEDMAKGNTKLIDKESNETNNKMKEKGEAK
ncbi:hypothetical protein EIN_400020 [Entamoeba invadens IP1]|uniref:Uncharacterized protein n=1 Tax=Entamoeba invadens IP1 TaxID=370355 RepID=A0A0A1UA94_ENTIV|nr:hypothetical protein EIN_400020 [Entamoeba invadens IP1]ELP91942.1 hypothetical protein EIN_400020 [Entamoeba invadens IP1]|eukprot:XP_004258713.1 hypothetical protein EIN_400020 [Entamoeba invadens IP1]